MTPSATSAAASRNHRQPSGRRWLRLAHEDWDLLSDYAARRGLRLTQLLRSCALDRALGNAEQEEVSR